MKMPFIMIVDDEKSFVETLTKRLSKRDIKTLKAFSGEEALQTMETNQHLDVVVLDVKMPGMDGIETLRVLKETYPLVEVIMLTGHGTIESAIQGMKRGAFDYLMKPCDIDELVGKVNEAARKKREQEEKIRNAKSKEMLSSYEP